MAVVGVGVWFATKIRPAAAEVTDRPRNYRPPEFEKIRKKYESERQTGLKWKPAAPVSDEDIHKYILRADYENKSPKHWIFSGPMPPTKERGPDTGPVVEEGPKHLETLGKVTTVIYNPPDKTVVLFSFTASKRSRAFGIGEWVLEESDAPKLYKITAVVEVALPAEGTKKKAGPKAYKIHYAVFGKDKEKPRMEGVVPYGTEGAPPWPAYLGPVVPPKPVASAATPGALPGGAAGEALGTGPGAVGATGEAPAAGTGAEVVATENPGETTPTLIEVARLPLEKITIVDMRPEVRPNPNNRNERAVIVDDNTYRVLRSKRAKDIASTVKTEVAVDRKTGRTLGMRITGLKDGSAAGALQVKKGDILVSINGRRVESRSAAISIVEGLKPEGIVTVVIDRHGRLLTYKVDPRDPKTRRQVRYFENLK